MSLSKTELRLRLSKMHRRAQAAEKAVHDLQEQYDKLRYKYERALGNIIAVGAIHRGLFGGYKLLTRDFVSCDVWNRFVGHSKAELAAERHYGGVK